MTHDWNAAIATPFYIPGGSNVFKPFAYARPDGTSATVCGDTIAVLRVNGAHADLISYTDKHRPDPSSGWQCPSGEAFDKVFGVPRRLLGATTVAALRAATGPLLPQPVSTLITCPECDGAGEVTCYACDREHECDECDGTGQIGDDGTKDVPEAYLQIDDRLFCVHHLAAPLARVPDGPVEARVAPTPGGGGAVSLSLAGDGWELLCMSLSHPLASGVSAGDDIRPFAIGEPAASAT